MKFNCSSLSQQIFVRWQSRNCVQIGEDNDDSNIAERTFIHLTGCTHSANTDACAICAAKDAATTEAATILYHFVAHPRLNKQNCARLVRRVCSRLFLAANLGRCRAAWIWPATQQTLAYSGLSWVRAYSSKRV